MKILYITFFLLCLYTPTFGQTTGYEFRSSGSQTEVLMYLEVSDNYVEMKDDIVTQLSEDPDIAPALLGFLQSFLNEIYHNLDQKSKAGICCKPASGI